MENIIESITVETTIREHQKCLDIQTGKMVMIEKIDDRFIVLDATFGLSTKSSDLHLDWIQKYQDDGRYSLSWKEAEGRLFFTYSPPK